MQETRARFIAIVVLILLAGYIVAPMEKKWPAFIDRAELKKGIDLDKGAELTYRLLIPPGYSGDPEAATREAMDVLQKRIDRRGLKEIQINVQGVDQIVIQLPGVDETDIKGFKRLLQKVGRLEFKAVGDKTTHETYNAEKRVPPGYEPYPSPIDSSGADYQHLKANILCKKDPVVTGDDVSNATIAVDPRSLGTGRQTWQIDLTLTEEGSDKFDAAAVALYEQDPKGRIAIILDGKINIAPVIQARSYGGRAQITGNFGHEEAKDLANILKSGNLPFPIGRRIEGVDIPGIPEAEFSVGEKLGQDSIQRGVTAMATAGGVMTVFMIVYYLGAWW